MIRTYLVALLLLVHAGPATGAAQKPAAPSGAARDAPSTAADAFAGRWVGRYRSPHVVVIRADGTLTLTVANARSGEQHSEYNGTYKRYSDTILALSGMPGQYLYAHLGEEGELSIHDGLPSLGIKFVRAPR